MAALKDPTTKIHIIGSGVFGLSTALWLARTGYTDITVFDMQDTLSTGYDPDQGIDSASADWNKIIRFSYGKEIEYQRLAFEAAGIWEEWNREFVEADEGTLPLSLREGERRLWFNSGMLRVSATGGIGEFEEETLRNMASEGLRGFQFDVSDVRDLRRAEETGWARKLDPTGRRERSGVHAAVLDSTAGWVKAFRCCAWAQHLARHAGVKFVLAKGTGEVSGIGEHECRPVVETADGKVHAADLVIVAGGGWTPSLLSEASDLLETTAGSVATIQIPKDRKDLWEKYAPENFPVFSWGSHQGKDIYNFPRDERGAIKIGYRHTKYVQLYPARGPGCQLIIEQVYQFPISTNRATDFHPQDSPCHRENRNEHPLSSSDGDQRAHQHQPSRPRTIRTGFDEALLVHRQHRQFLRRRYGPWQERRGRVLRR